MDEKIKLKVAGISYSPMQNGAFALLLAVDDGNEDSKVHIPVVIGAAEAQSIAILIEGVNSPRPMTHDLFRSFAQAFGIRLTEVFIYKFEDGIYSSEMTFTDGSQTVVLDSRTSDAIAVAMRTGAPIYTTPAIVDECGIDLQEVDSETADGGEDDEEIITGDLDFDPEDVEAMEQHIAEATSAQDNAAEVPLERLEERLKRLVELEDYEGAARLRKEIDRRRQEGGHA